MYYEQKQAMESVEVIAHFHNLQIDIIKFKWKNKTYKVDHVANKWKINDGKDIVSHFIAICKDSELLCELSFNHSDMKWEIIQWDNLV
ncbi:MAG: hypothetical protein EHM58_11770 [Ignavibacteriae bacterium]|nr:MAG: hypothetical protein EHM58_11770 [Ignavibacteriota bacterium]